MTYGKKSDSRSEQNRGRGGKSYGQSNSGDERPKRNAAPRYSDDNKPKKDYPGGGYQGKKDGDYKPKRSYGSSEGAAFSPKKRFDGESRSSGGYGDKKRFDGDSRSSSGYDASKKYGRGDSSESRPRRSDSGEGQSRSYGDKKRFDGGGRSSGGYEGGKKYGRGDSSESRPRRSDSGEGQSRSYGDKKRFDGDSRSSGGYDASKKYGRGDSSESRPRRSDSGEGQSRSYGDKKRFDGGGRSSGGYEGGKKYGRGDSSESRPRRSDSGEGQSRSYGDRAKPGEQQLGKYAGKGRPYKPEYKKKSIQEKDFDGLTRLNKYISNAGVCSRREADELISQGLVSVNGEVVTEMGFKVKKGDEVRMDGRVLKPEPNVYVLLNKPKDFITTTDDPENRKTVMNLVAGACNERIYPVGRLDRNTTGLLLLTNDGELADKLAHPSSKMKKVYQVTLDKPLTKADFEAILQGLQLEDGLAIVDELAYVDDDKRIIGIELHIGRNRIVRRIFEHLGYKVVYLDRVMYAGLTKKDLPRGTWRYLNEREVIQLKHLKI